MKLNKAPGNLIQAPISFKKRVMIAIPMTGLLRSEWVIARYGQVIPCNWSATECLNWIDQYSPVGYLVADAYNICATQCVELGYEWLLTLEHDTIIPPNFFLVCNDRMVKNEIPMWSGLYFTKSVPAEPILYRGRGNGCYTDWKLGDEVWVDGIPMGAGMIHSSLLKVLYDESETYSIGGRKVKRIFETPQKVFIDPETHNWFTSSGTQDLNFCTRIIENDVFAKAGWKKYAKKKYPFMVDTNIFCWHIDFDGRKYPSLGEEKYFARK